MLKIYGHFLSAPSNKVRLAASALDLEFEYHSLELTQGEHKAPAYLRVNPVGKVPAIDDDGFCLFESDAIIRYLANKSNSPLYPTEIKARAQTDQWIDFSYKHILLNVGRVLFNTRFAPSMGIEPSEESIADGKKFLLRFLPLVENQLSENEYLCGSDMTLADIGLLASLEPVEFIKYDISAYPSIVSWRQKMMNMEFYQRVHAHYAAELPPRE